MSSECIEDNLLKNNKKGEKATKDKRNFRNYLGLRHRCTWAPEGGGGGEFRMIVRAWHRQGAL